MNNLFTKFHVFIVYLVAFSSKCSFCSLHQYHFLSELFFCIGTVVLELIFLILEFCKVLQKIFILILQGQVLLLLFLQCFCILIVFGGQISYLFMQLFIFMNFLFQLIFQIADLPLHQFKLSIFFLQLIFIDLQQFFKRLIFLSNITRTFLFLYLFQLNFQILVLFGEQFNQLCCFFYGFFHVCTILWMGSAMHYWWMSENNDILFVLRVNINMNIGFALEIKMNIKILIVNLAFESEAFLFQIRYKNLKSTQTQGMQVSIQTQEFYQNYCQKLLCDEEFLKKLQQKVNPSYSMTKTAVQSIVEQMGELIEHLIKLKLEKQMSELIDDNNRILQEIKKNFENSGRNSSSKIQTNKQQQDIEGIGGLGGASFTDIHNLIAQERKKMSEQFNDADLERSISIIDKYEDIVEKVYEIQKKVKCLQDRYQTNFKSLWNVLSMTESAVFEHIKENRDKKPQKTQSQIKQKKNQSIFNFWK